MSIHITEDERKLYWGDTGKLVGFRFRNNTLEAELFQEWFPYDDVLCGRVEFDMPALKKGDVTFDSQDPVYSHLFVRNCKLHWRYTGKPVALNADGCFLLCGVKQCAAELLCPEPNPDVLEEAVADGLLQDPAKFELGYAWLFRKAARVLFLVVGTITLFGLFEGWAISIIAVILVLKSEAITLQRGSVILDLAALKRSFH